MVRLIEPDKQEAKQEVIKGFNSSMVRLIDR